MSKAVRLVAVVAVVLMVVSIAFAFWALSQRQTLAQQNQELQNQISEYQGKESQLLAQAKKLQEDAQALNQKVDQKEREKSQVQNSYDEIKRKVDQFNAQLDQAKLERDDWKNRVSAIQRERDDLAEKLKNRPTQIVYKEAEPKPAEAVAPVASPAVTTAQGEEYWASILKQKAALQLEIDKIKADLELSVGQIADLKKQNSDLQLQIKSVTNDKEEIERKIKYGEDLANNLSIELARSRNDQRFVNERADKLKEENIELQGQIRQLSGTKLTLEKTVTRLNDEKEGIQRKLIETESVIQARINEIWQIKESVDQKLASAAASRVSNQVELSPIIVNAGNRNVSVAPPAAAASAKQASVVSINETNNFVIVDMGESTGIKVGHVLKVLRGNSEIATLEVIQVRKDISAADIKQKTGNIKIGDSVKSFASNN